MALWTNHLPVYIWFLINLQIPQKKSMQNRFSAVTVCLCTKNPAGVVVVFLVKNKGNFRIQRLWHVTTVSFCKREI